MEKTNPFYREGSGWFFLDETGDEYGPYSCKELAKAWLNLYVHWLNTGQELCVISSMNISDSQFVK